MQPCAALPVVDASRRHARHWRTRRPFARRSPMNRVLRAAAVCLFLLSCSSAGPEEATRAGRLSSDAEGPMEGVLVSARREGSAITVTVVSDAKGRFQFPAGRLPPGDYAIRTRA